MRTYTSIVAAGLSAVALLGAVSMTVAAPGQKKPAKGDAKAGQKVYMANGCAACHVIGATGGKTGPALTKIGADKKWPAPKLANVVRKGAPPKMPAYGPDKISDKDLANLVAYMQSLK